MKELCQNKRVLAQFFVYLKDCYGKEKSIIILAPMFALHILLLTHYQPQQQYNEVAGTKREPLAGSVHRVVLGQEINCHDGYIGKQGKSEPSGFTNFTLHNELFFR